MSDHIRLTKSDLTGFAAAIFTAAGVAPAMAATWAQGVVWANLRGVDSHGVIRIPRYVDLLKKKSINPRPAMKVERRAGAIAVLGNASFGFRCLICGSSHLAMSPK